MNLKKTYTKIFIPIFAAAIIASVSMRTAALILDFNSKIGYFDSKIFITAASIIAAIGSILLFSSAFIIPREKKLIASFSTPQTYIPTGAVCTALSIFMMHGISQLSQMGLPLFSLLSIRDLRTSSYVLTVFLAAASIIYFALTALLTEKESAVRAGFGFANVLFLSLYVSFLYFDTELSINAPNKIVDQMAFLFAALFFLYEVRISLGRAVWNFYIAFGLVAATLSAYSSIPSLIVYFTNGITVSKSVYENILSFCIFVFISCRLILALRLKEDKESEFIPFIKKYSSERDSLSAEAASEALSAYIKTTESSQQEIINVNQSQEDSLQEEQVEEDLIELASSEDVKEEPAVLSATNEEDDI